jgi:coenzyme F420-reducing hydrogenase alpha subunit
VREYGHAPVTRLVARLVDLARSLDELAGAPPAAATPPRARSVALAAGDGLGVVETARGLLLHRVLLDGDRVVDYQIVAPTEWNFHRNGALVTALAGAAETVETALLRRARVAVHALDPCVGWRIEVSHA